MALWDNNAQSENLLSAPCKELLLRFGVSLKMWEPVHEVKLPTGPAFGLPNCENQQGGLLGWEAPSTKQHPRFAWPFLVFMQDLHGGSQ